MTDKDDSDKQAPTRPSIKVSLPVELYYTRMSKMQQETCQENAAPREKEKEKNSKENNSEGEKSECQPDAHKETEINVSLNSSVPNEQTPTAANAHAPLAKLTTEYLGIPLSSFQTPRTVENAYPWSTNRPHPYRYQNYTVRVQRPQRFCDYNNNDTAQRPLNFVRGRRDDGSRTPSASSVPKTESGPKFT